MPDEYPRPLDPPLAWEGALKVGLLGRKITHSLSPVIHEQACRAHGIPLDFKLLDPGTETDLERLLAELHGQGLRGLSVTMPYKRSLDEILLGVSPAAISVGAVNLLVRSEDGWVGDNTDVAGFIGPLARRQLLFETALIVGCGGAARAAAHALLSMPFVKQVFIRCRDLEQAELLAQEFETDEKPWQVLPWEETQDPCAELLINATPLGTRTEDADPVEQELPCPLSWLKPGRTLFDMVYQPRETAWLNHGRTAGAECIEGLEMLIFQARPAFQAWTGKDFPTDDILTEYDL